MKISVFVLLWAISLTTYTQEVINWISIEEVQELVKNEPRKIIIMVYTDWCTYCQNMEATTFKDPEIIKYINSHFYAVKLNAETKEPIIFKGRTYTNPQPDKEKSKHRLALSFAAIDKTIGFPTFVFFDDNLNRLMSPIRGYKSKEKLEMYLQYIIQDIYKSKSFEEYRKTITRK